MLNRKKLSARLGRLVLFLVAIAMPGFLTTALADQVLYAVTTSNNLLQFDSAAPCTILSELAITGLQADEAIMGIDFRPATGQLYGLGSSSRLYTIDTITGGATPVGVVPFVIPVKGKAAGIDFNPTVDRVRIVTNTGQNLRIHPVTGVIVGFDTNLAFAVADLNNGIQPLVAAAAYTNPDNDPATGTTLYDLDARRNILAIQNPPNSGTLNTVGSVGINIKVLNGFDIASSGIAYAAIKSDSTDGQCGVSGLYTINLATGSATSLGFIGSPEVIRGLAAPTP